MPRSLSYSSKSRHPRLTLSRASLCQIMHRWTASSARSAITSLGWLRR
uniref:Uncharacterized protein n=1 Tax=Arundo donax TaxID=35708 RepID=A0A0A9ESI6_ARUDO